MAVLWAAAGSVAGIAIGLVLVALHGFSMLSLSFWLSVGILTGAIAGFISFFLYGISYRMIKRKEPPQIFHLDNED